MPDGVILQLAVPAGAGRVLARVLGGRQGRAAALELHWHDADEPGFVWTEQRGRAGTAWRFEHLAAFPGAGPALADPPGPPPDGLPVASFIGTTRRLTGGAVAATLIEGALHHAGAGTEVARLTLSGAPAPVLDAALALAEAGGRIAPLPLAATAVGLTPAAAAAPLPPQLGTGEAFAALTAQFNAMILLHAPGVLAAQDTVPVHQMRVAVRRLRSAIALFRRAVEGPEVALVQDELRALMRLLGPARDWDVFLAGTGAEIAARFPDEPAVTALREAATAARLAAYAALEVHLESAAFRALGLRLAWLAAAQPWTDAPGPGQARALAADLETYAGRMLARVWGRMAAVGDALDDLPEPALHALRLRGKRMRYACEFFAPLFPGRGARRWTRRLADLQESLGRLNDGAVAAALMQALGPAGAGHAGGLVRGFVAGRSADLRAEIAQCWRRLLRLDPFWR